MPESDARSVRHTGRKRERQAKRKGWVGGKERERKRRKKLREVYSDSAEEAKRQKERELSLIHI